MAPCAAGRWSNNTGLSMKCPGACPVAGTYSIATGLTRPEDCEGRLCPGDGNYSPLVGVPTAEKCERLPCPAGRFGASDGLASAFDCTPCSVGKTSVGADVKDGAARESNACALCPGGRFNPSTNLTEECTVCDAGKMAPAGAPFCFFMCSLGQYWDNASEVCGTCSPGKSRTLPTFTICTHMRLAVWGGHRRRTALLPIGGRAAAWRPCPAHHGCLAGRRAASSRVDERRGRRPRLNRRVLSVTKFH